VDKKKNNGFQYEEEQSCIRNAESYVLLFGIGWLFKAQEIWLSKTQDIINTL